jgi:D-alanyl-D-alanine carboxypeptidase/D-alanyl-D-alanine-endopeptidase (penicillin-binding protein 4)
MVLDLKAHGVHRVDGDIVVDQQHFDEQTTPPAFEQQPNEWSAFRAPVSAVALNENTITLTVRPATGGNPAHVSFDPPGFVDSTGTVKTSEEGADNVVLELSGSGRRMNAKLSGVVAEESKLVRYTRRVEDPSLLAGYALKAVLDEAGVKVGGDVKAGSPKNPKAIVTHDSAPLSQLLYEVGKHSDNFYAEMIFKSLGGEKKGKPARHADASQVVVEWAQKNGAFDQGTVIKNGSGLFDANRVTASGVAQLLRAAYRDPSVGPEFVAQLAVGGVDGTLHKRFRDQRTRRSVRAKTGTLEDAIALSGYVLGPPGKGPVAFSIVFNHVAGHASSARLAADALVEHLAKRQWAH